jgi:predicted DNA-binding transcriptional regulator AlpA
MEQAERLIPEKELIALFGLKKSELDNLRRTRGLPYVRFSSRNRVYLLSDLLAWAKRNRIVPEPVSDQ